MLRVMNIRTGVPMKKSIEALVAKKLRCSPADIEHICVVRRSVDARRKPNIYLVFTVDVAFHDEEKYGGAAATPRMSAGLRKLPMFRRSPAMSCCAIVLSS